MITARKATITREYTKNKKYSNKNNEKAAEKITLEQTCEFSALF